MGRMAQTGGISQTQIIGAQEAMSLPLPGDLCDLFQLNGAHGFLTTYVILELVAGLSQARGKQGKWNTIKDTEEEEGGCGTKISAMGKGQGGRGFQKPPGF